MSVDKFGRTSFHLQQKHGFFQTLHEEEEVIDAKKRRIINVESPIEDTNCANKIYVDEKVSEINLLSYDLADLYSVNSLESETAKKTLVYTTVVKENLKKYFNDDKKDLSEIVEEYLNKSKNVSSADAAEIGTSKEQLQVILQILLAIFSKWEEKKK